MGSEIIFIIPAALGFAAIATLGGTLVVWLVWMLARRWRPLSRRGGSSHFPIGATAAALLAISLPAGCIRACQLSPSPKAPGQWLHSRCPCLCG